MISLFEDGFIDQIIQFRQKLHSFPELSGFEKETSILLKEFVSKAHPTTIVDNLGGYGVAFVFDSGIDGPVTLFRSDIDALPIEENSKHSYCSKNKGIAHLCGHDGHSAVLAGLAHLISKNQPKKGKVILLFQPAEETGKGAFEVISDPQFKDLKPDYCFAFHNLPGFDRGSIVIKEGSFASASTGIVIRVKGKPSHAAHPENGNNPDKAIGELILELNKIANDKTDFLDFVLLTIIHVQIGEVAFGTTPGNGVVMLTIRSYLNEDLDRLLAIVKSKTISITQKFNLEVEFSKEEPFLATINDIECVKMVRLAAKNANINTIELNSPFRWSEDFGQFSSIAPSVLFGVGSGVNHPQLHNENYDFPDAIIENALTVFYNIYKKINI